jgi:hypothetical protein
LARILKIVAGVAAMTIRAALTLGFPVSKISERIFSVAM